MSGLWDWDEARQARAPPSTEPAGGAPLRHRVFRLFARPADDLCDVGPTDPARELARVLVAQGRVLDLGDDRHTTLQRRYPALGVVQIDVVQRRANRELEQRSSSRHQIAKRAVIGSQP